MTAIIIFIVILAILILSHEFGHFIVAKKSGIRVDEFGLGFPPRLVGWKKGETTYSLNAIPFGGFVKIFGENPDEESISGPDAVRSMVNKSKWIQAAVLVAGVTFNLLLAWLLISLGFMVGLPTPVDQIGARDRASASHLLVTSVVPDSPAAKAGLKAGDEIQAIALAKETNVPSVSLLPSDIQTFVTSHPNEELAVYYLRGKIFDTSKQHSTSALSRAVMKPEIGLAGDKPAIGIGMDRIALVRKGFFASLGEGFLLTARLVYLTVAALVDLIRQAFVGKASLSNITGPVGLVGLVGDAKTLGFIYLLSFTAFISINLAVINLIPFPALDGGRLLFLLIEKLKGSPIKPVVANTLNFIGFGLLLLLMAVVTFSDITKLLH